MHGAAVVALVALEGETFDMKSFAQLAITFLWSLICSLLDFDGLAAAAWAFHVMPCLRTSKLFLVC